MKKRRSYEKVGRPSKDFEDKCEQGRRDTARKILAINESFMAHIKATKMKADEEGHSDASFVLSLLYENPIENAAKIRAALKTAESEGKSHFLP